MKICKIEGCNKKVYCRELCCVHYRELRASGELGRQYIKRGSRKGCRCIVEGCNLLAYRCYLCTKHYQRWLKNGRDYSKLTNEYLKTHKWIPIAERIKLNTEPDLETGCWIWQKGKDKQGYGQFSIRNKNYRAHRVSFMEYIGPIPKGMQVLHTCDNPSCVNPAHLFLGTNDDNMADMVQKDRQIKGENKENSKLTEGQVREIKKRLLGTETVSDIARDYPVDRKVVSRIKAGTAWAHIKI